MSAEIFPQVRAGDPLKIPAATWNALMALGRSQQAANPLPMGSVLGGELPPGVVWVRNDSDQARQAFDILGISDILIAPSANESEFLYTPGLVGVTPVAPNHIGKWMVLLEPIAAGQIGRARLFGIASIRVDVTDEEHTFAEIANGEPTMLASGKTGSAQILWRESGTGTKRALIRLPIIVPPHQARWIRFKITQTGNPATASVLEHWDGESPGNTVLLTYADVYQMNETGMACYNPEEDVYVALPKLVIESVDVSVLADWRLDGLNYQTRQKTLAVLKDVATGNWTTVATGTECP